MLCKLAIFVAPNGVSSGFRKHLSSIRRDGVTIILLEKHDFESLLASPELNVIAWLEKSIASRGIH
jgi:hypothetical protein